MNYSALGVGNTGNLPVPVVTTGGFSLPYAYDAYTVELANGGLDVVYKFRDGGIAGTVLATVTLTYNTVQTLTNTSGTIT